MAIYDIAALEPEALCQAIGIVGFLIYAGGFFALSLGKLNCTQPLCFLMVFIASSCVMVSLWVDFKLPTALIQSFYIAMSLGAIALRMRKRLAPVV